MIRDNPGRIAFLVFYCIARPALAQEPGVYYDNPEQAVEAGRDALGGWSDYPWYDPSTDDIRRIDVKEPWNWWDWFDGFGWNGTWGGGGIGLVNIFMWLGWLLLAVLLALAAYYAIRAYLARETSMAALQALPTSADRAAEIERVDDLPFRVKRPQGDLLGEARRHYLAGNYGEAIIYLYSYQLVVLDRHHVIRLARGKTNRQYLREARSQSGVGDLLEQTMLAFEDVFFGNHPLLRRQFEACWTRLDEFIRQLEATT